MLVSSFKLQVASYKINSTAIEGKPTPMRTDRESYTVN